MVWLNVFSYKIKRWCIPLPPGDAVAFHLPHSENIPVLCPGPWGDGNTLAGYVSLLKDGSWWVSESSSMLRRTPDPQILLHGIPPCSPYPDGGRQIELFLNEEMTPNVFCRFSSLKIDEIGNPNMKQTAFSQHLPQY